MADTLALLDAGRMGIVALTVVIGVVLFDAHEFINRKSRRS